MYGIPVVKFPCVMILKDGMAIGKKCLKFGLGSRVKASCPHVGRRHRGEMPFVGVYLKDSNPYLREFWRKI